MKSHVLAPVAALLLFFSTSATSACRSTDEDAPPPAQYVLKGQVLAVNSERQEITVAHDDIPDFMPGMTMSFPVSTPELMRERQPGELIVATLEVSNFQGRLTSITRTGMDALPEASSTTPAVDLLQVGDAVPDVALIDQTDTRRAFAEWKGTFTLVTFIYTRCPLPNYCPLMDQNFATIQRAVAEDPLLKGQVKLVSVTFDPEHDTPAVLAAHAERRRADPAVWTFLTGDRVTVDRFAARFAVATMRTEGQVDITHNLRTALIDREGKIVAIYSGNSWTPGAVLSDLRAAMRGR